MITKTDKNIILELQRNGRASYAEMAEKLGISVSTAATRAERLLQAKIIEIRAIPNPFKIGLHANALIAIQAEPQKIDGICDQLVDNYNISTVLTVFGRYDILIFVYFLTWEILHSFIHEHLSKLDGVKKVETFYLKEFKKRYEQLFKKPADDFKPNGLQDIEWRLILELAKNGRMNMSEISEKIGIHVSNVSRRIHSLIEDDICKIVAIPHPQYFGYLANAFMILDVRAVKVDEACAVLASQPQIVVVSTLINGSGIVVGIQRKEPSSSGGMNSLKKKSHKSMAFKGSRPLLQLS